MKSKTNHIESKRLRLDATFSRIVKIFGFLVLATFATLILHILYNAAPLFNSPDAEFEQSVPMPGNSSKEIKAGSTAKSLGATAINSQWLAVSYENCALRLHRLSLNDQQSIDLVKRFAPQCNKEVLGLIGDGKQTIAMLTSSGIFEVYKIHHKPNFQLQLLGSFQLPDEFSKTDAAKSWHISFKHQSVFVWQTKGKNVQAFWHDLNSLNPPKIIEYLNTSSVLPVLKFEQVIAFNANEVRVVNKNQRLIQAFTLPSNIVHAQILENAVDLFLLTQDKTSTQDKTGTQDKAGTQDIIDIQAHKYTLFNNNGEFLLNKVFSHNLLPLFEPNITVLATTQSANSKAASNDLASANNHHFTQYFAHLDAQQNILMLFDQYGTAAIFNAVTGERVNDFVVDTNIQNVDYARGRFVITYTHKYAMYALDDLPGITTMDAMFAKNTYSGYTEPAYIWQTSMSSDAQSAKYSVIPLIMGSLKASLLALIVALPLALGAAIYTAYFASAKVRNSVKPVIEMLEAIPAVIIGFIAAIWLAPFAERYLVSIFVVVLMMPFVLVLIALIHGYLQSKVMATKLENWQLFINAVLLVLAVSLIIVLSFLFTNWSVVENTDGFINSISGLSLSKTAIVVSLALGIAVAPTIYTLIDDALFEVPDGVKQAAFALGATPIQTLFKVVLVVALPSIVSAIMLGFGRAFGETMIVLMVTGNTPIADWDLLSGLRTLTSNLAIELQEAQIGSTLYHVLFFTAAVLFVFTFVINTIAALLKRRMHRGM